jgi:hypothetical protein
LLSHSAQERVSKWEEAEKRKKSTNTLSRSLAAFLAEAPPALLAALVVVAHSAFVRAHWKICLLERHHLSQSRAFNGRGIHLWKILTRPSWMRLAYIKCDVRKYAWEFRRGPGSEPLVQRKRETEKRCSGAKWISRTRPTINNAFLGSAGHISRCCRSLLSHLPRKSQLAPLLLFLII